MASSGRRIPADYRARIDQRVQQLTVVLLRELKVAPERSLRGGPRTARRAVTQLVRLGKSAQVHLEEIVKRDCIYLGQIVKRDYIYLWQIVKKVFMSD